VDLTAYRKAYFALCRRLGLDADTRHEFNRARVGKESTVDFAVADWRDVVAELQHRVGQDVRPGRPRIRSRRDRPGDDGDMITPAQLEFLCSLAAQIHWRHSLYNFIRQRLLRPLRRENWDGTLETLFRGEAVNVIAALKNMARREKSGSVVPQMSDPHAMPVAQEGMPCRTSV
jgi:hypothetical protein